MQSHYRDDIRVTLAIYHGTRLTSHHVHQYYFSPLLVLLYVSRVQYASVTQRFSEEFAPREIHGSQMLVYLLGPIVTQSINFRR